MAERSEQNKSNRKMKTIDVSIVIPVYNVSAYIERCIESVMKQDYKGCIECLIINDDTPDDSIEKCEVLIKNYNGPIEFRIIAHKVNLGLSGARNTGTDNAKGKYVYYLDSDDSISEDCISKMMHVVSLHPEVEMVQGGITCIPDNGHYDQRKYDNIDYIDSNDWIRKEYFQIGGLNTNAWNKLILLSFLKENNLSFKQGLIHEDQLWMFHVCKKLSKYSYVPQFTYYHFVTPNSIMTSMGNIDDKRSCLAWRDIINEVLLTLDDPYYDRQLYYYLWVLMRKYEGIENARTIMKRIINLAENKGMKFSAVMSRIFLFMPFSKGRTLIFHILWNLQKRRISHNIKLL